MSLRDYLQKLDERGELIRISAPISKTHEIAGVLKQLEPKTVDTVYGEDTAAPPATN